MDFRFLHIVGNWTKPLTNLNKISGDLLTRNEYIEYEKKVNPLLDRYLKGERTALLYTQMCELK